MLITYDSSVDAAYIYLREDPKVAKSVVIDEQRVVDLDDAGEVVGIEILEASGGFVLNDIIERFHLEARSNELNQAAKEFRPAATV